MILPNRRLCNITLILMVILAQACKTGPGVNPDMCHGPVVPWAMADVEAEPVERVAPVLPRDYARAAIRVQQENSSRGGKDIQAHVELEFVVNIDGSVCDVSVVKSSNIDSVDRAAVKALEQWRYEPARVDDHAVRVLGRQTIDFVVEASGS